MTDVSAPSSTHQSLHQLTARRYLYTCFTPSSTPTYRSSISLHQFHINLYTNLPSIDTSTSTSHRYLHQFTTHGCLDIKLIKPISTPKYRSKIFLHQLHLNNISSQTSRHRYVYTKLLFTTPVNTMKRRQK